MRNINVPSSSALESKENRVRAIQNLYWIVKEIYEQGDPGQQKEIEKLSGEVYDLKKIVGDLGGNVIYEIPDELGKTFNTLMGNNGTVKLTDSVTTGRYGPGILAKNKVTLNLNNHDLTITNAGNSGGIQARGT